MLAARRRYSWHLGNQTSKPSVTNPMRLNALWLILATAVLAAACSTTEPSSPTEAQVSTTVASTAVEISEVGTTIADYQPTNSGASACDPDSDVICILPGDAIFDERWVATVTIECGSESSTRRLVAFEAETAGYGEPVLSLGEVRADGSVRYTVWPVVGDEFNAERFNFSWNIQNVLLGPWEVDEIIDTCVAQDE